jgi:uncharacterized membrane protein
MKRRIVHMVSAATVALTLAVGAVAATAASEEHARKVNEYEGQHLAKKGSFDITEADGMARKVNEYEGQHRLAEQGDPSQWGIALTNPEQGDVVATTNPS